MADGAAVPASEERRRVLVVVDAGSAALEPLRRLLATETLEVVVAEDTLSALEKFDELAPALVVLDTEDSSLGGVAERLREAGIKVLPVELLRGTLALLDGAQLLA